MLRVNLFLAAVYLYLLSIFVEIGVLYYFLKEASGFSKGIAIGGAIFVVICFIAVFAAILFNLAGARKYYGGKNYSLLRKAMKRMKLGAVPFFIFNFLICLLVAAVMFGASRGFAVFVPWVWAWVFTAVAVTWIITAGSSCYGIFFARLLRQRGQIAASQMTKHIVLQLIFVLDVIDTLVLLKITRPEDGEHV